MLNPANIEVLHFLASTGELRACHHVMIDPTLRHFVDVVHLQSLVDRKLGLNFDLERRPVPIILVLDCRSLLFISGLVDRLELGAALHLLHWLLRHGLRKHRLREG